MLTRASQPAILAADVWGRAELVRLEDRPTDPRAYYHFSLAALAEQRGNLETAIAETEAALRYDPTSPYLRLSLGGLLMRRGAFAEAIRQAEEVLRGTPRNVRAHLLLASAYL
ncbi:MAG: tetratricopeptide repeat protein, partial [Candidatus Methylomirabilales bacterium]